MDPKFLIFVLSNVTSHFSDKSEQGSEGDQNTSRVGGISTRPDQTLVLMLLFIYLLNALYLEYQYLVQYLITQNEDMEGLYGVIPIQLISYLQK